MNVLGANDWVGHPNCDSPSEAEKLLIDRRADIIEHGYVSDAEACYSYDDWALVQLDNVYYLLNTSGCSCPDPNETWGVQFSGTLDEVERHLLDEHNGRGYGVTNRQHAEFLQMVANARAAEGK